MEPRTVVIAEPRAVARFLATAAACLFAAHVAGLVAEYGFGRDTLLGLVPLFDLDQERNAPTLFSASLFLVAAALAFLVARANRGAAGRARGWTFLAAVACFLAVDEVASIHEMFAHPLRESLGAAGFLRHAWVIPYGAAAAIAAALVVPLIRGLAPSSRRRFIVAGVIYVSGAIGLEMVGGKYQELAGVTRNLVYEAIATTEESMEIAGLILLVHALVSLLRLELGGAAIAIPAAAVASPDDRLERHPHVSPTAPATPPLPGARKPQRADSAHA
jgi:hypothetical protein